MHEIYQQWYNNLKVSKDICQKWRGSFKMRQGCNRNRFPLHLRNSRIPPGRASWRAFRMNMEWFKKITRITERSRRNWESICWIRNCLQTIHTCRGISWRTEMILLWLRWRIIFCEIPADISFWKRKTDMLMKAEMCSCRLFHWLWGWSSAKSSWIAAGIGCILECNGLQRAIRPGGAIGSISWSVHVYLG